MLMSYGEVHKHSEMLWSKPIRTCLTRYEAKIVGILKLHNFNAVPKTKRKTFLKTF
jgi:hypothetical protein